MNIKLSSLLIILFSFQALAQAPPTAPPPTAPVPAAPLNPGSATTATHTTPLTDAANPNEVGDERPNGARIRRQLNLIYGVDHDEEFLIPNREILVKGAGSSEALDIKRIRGTDFFRITPKKPSSGVATFVDKKTGQILVELRYDIRDGVIEKQMREIQSLLGDIEGLEYKIVNGNILLDGYVLLSRDLIRIANVVKQFSGAKSLATLSPIARKKVVEYIARDVNNPEVSITAVGDYIKLEGIVNNKDEHNRILRIVSLYMPDLVIDQGGDLDHLKIVGRKSGGKVEDFIIDLIAEKKDEEKTEPAPKMIQVVVHFVQFIERYGKNFSFRWEPSFAAATSSAGTLNDTYNLIDRLAPKLQWAKAHGYARVLDTASILTQDKKNGHYTNKITIFSTIQAPAPAAGQPAAPPVSNNIVATVDVNVTPAIKSERSGLIELPLSVSVDDTDSGKQTNNSVTTTISVRDRQSAAFAGIIKKKSVNDFGGTPEIPGAIVTFKSSKKYEKSSSNFVVFITPIIKSSASAGVDQVKKKFRLRE